MNEFQNLLVDSRDLTADQIIEIFEKVGKRGDIIIIKNDGLRLSDNFTVVISSSSNKFDSIRYDANSISNAIRMALKNYAEVIHVS
jgi:hypothetical protein